MSYLNDRNTLVINRALIKYGYSNFSACALEILEYCDKANLEPAPEREQYYFYKLGPAKLQLPKYNTLKVAGSSSGHKLTVETKAKISRASFSFASLKGVYTKENSPLYGTIASEQTKNLG